MFLTWIFEVVFSASPHPHLFFSPEIHSPPIRVILTFRSDHFPPMFETFDEFKISFQSLTLPIRPLMIWFMSVLRPSCPETFPLTLCFHFTGFLFVRPKQAMLVAFPAFCTFPLVYQECSSSRAGTSCLPIAAFTEPPLTDPSPVTFSTTLYIIAETYLCILHIRCIFNISGNGKFL